MFPCLRKFGVGTIRENDFDLPLTPRDCVPDLFDIAVCVEVLFGKGVKVHYLIRLEVEHLDRGISEEFRRGSNGDKWEPVRSVRAEVPEGELLRLGKCGDSGRYFLETKSDPVDRGLIVAGVGA